MKILFFIDGLTAGGKERRLCELMKGLRQMPNVDFEVVVMKKKIHYQQVLDLNIKIHFLLRQTKKDLSVFRKFFNICRVFKPDFVHTWDDMTSLIAVPSCKLLRINLINGMVVDTPVKRNFSNKYWRRAKFTFPFSKMIIGNSEAGLKAYGAPVKKAACIYNGMDFNRFSNLKDPYEVHQEIFGYHQKPAFIVGMVAAFEPRKDYDTLIDGAISLVRSTNSVYFVLVGDGSEKRKLEKRVPKDLKQNIIFLGRRNDVESVINIFDVGVLLTNSKVHGEGISNSIIEYMALSKPVIATKGGGTSEVISSNMNGFLIDPESPEQFVSCIQKLYNDRSLGQKMGKAGKENVRAKFDLKIMTAKYLEMYKTVVHK